MPDDGNNQVGSVDVKRRTFLSAVSVLAAKAGFGSALAAAESRFEIDRTSMLADQLIKAYPERLSAVAVGDACLQGRAARPRLHGLIDELMTTLEIPASHLSAMTVGDLRARLKARTSDDFQTGRTVQVKGWLLGETEARLCSLTALCAV